MHIDREDMLELTRRMTIARNCFNRVAGAYMDEEGFIDGSFNTHFLKLSPADKEKQLAIAKTIPYAKTNEQLKNFRIDSRQKKPGSIWHLLTALRDCELKNCCIHCMNISGNAMLWINLTRSRFSVETMMFR